MLSRSTRWHIAIAALLAGAQAFAYGLVGSGFGDTDPYRHLQYAHQLWLSHFALRGHPFLPYTVLGSSGVDLWWGFHLLLIPFTAAGLVWSARLAGIAIAATSAGGMAWVAARMGQSRPAWFVLLPYATADYFAYRAHIARPAYLTPVLMFIGLAAGAGRLRARWAAGAAFAHGLLHISSPLSPVFAALGALGRGLAEPAERRQALRPVLASLGGLALSFVVRPDRDHYLQVAWSVATISLGWIPGGHLPQAGGELDSPGLLAFVSTTAGSAGALLLALAIAGQRTRAGSAAARSAAMLAALVSAVLALRVDKFFDYLLPALALATALWWPVERPGPAGLRRKLVAGVGGAVLAHAVWLVVQGWRFDVALFPTPGALALMAREVRRVAPRGSMLFTDDWGWAGVLYGFLPEYAYPLAYDPATLYGASPARFWIWEHASAEGLYCPHRELSQCPSASSGPEGVAQAMQSFGAEWVVARGTKGPHDLLHVVSAAPEWFELVARADSPREQFTVWHLKRPPDPAAASPNGGSPVEDMGE